MYYSHGQKILVNKDKHSSIKNFVYTSPVVSFLKLKFIVLQTGCAAIINFDVRFITLYLRISIIKRMFPDGNSFIKQNYSPMKL